MTETVKAVICAVAVLAVDFVAIWHNFNFSHESQQGQLVTNQLKNEKLALKLKES